MMSQIWLTGTVDLPPKLTGPIVGCCDDFTAVWPWKFHNTNPAFSLTFDAGTSDATAALEQETGNAEWLIGGTNNTNAGIAFVDGAVGGWIRFTTGATSGDEQCILKSGSCVAFAKSATDPLAFTFRTRVLINTITTSDQVFGVGPYDNTNCVETQGTGSVNIRIASGVVKYEYKTSAATVTALPLYLESGLPATVVAGRTYIFEIRWDGSGGLSFYMNGSLLLPSLSGSSPFDARPRPERGIYLAAFTAVTVNAHLGIGTTSAAAKTMDVDYAILLGGCGLNGR